MARIICWTLVFSMLSLTGAFIALGSLAILMLIIAGVKVWYKVDDLANITEPLTVSVAELREKVDTLELKIKDE